MFYTAARPDVYTLTRISRSRVGDAVFAHQHDQYADQRHGTADQHPPGELIVKQGDTEEDAEQRRQQRQRREARDDSD